MKPSFRKALLNPNDPDFDPDFDIEAERDAIDWAAEEREDMRRLD